MATSANTIRITSATDNPSGNLATDHYLIEVKGNIRHIQTPEHHLFVFGYFGHDTQNMLVDTAATTLDGNIRDQAFYPGLAGHFSLLVVGKTTPFMRIIANRVGGERVYCEQQPGFITVSNALEELSRAGSRPNSEALQELLRFRWLTASCSLIDGVCQVPPGHSLDLNLASRSEPRRYDTLWQKNQVEHIPLAVCSQKTEDALNNAIQKLLRPGRRTAILLSGGVDSSILAAIARQGIGNLVAISHQSPTHENPELETAQRFAQELGLEHLVIDVEDSTIADAFISATEIVEQPLRNQSLLILHQMFRSVAGQFDQIIYGEAADTLFGSNLAKRYVSRRMKQRKLLQIGRYIPFFGMFLSTVGRNTRTARLYDETLQRYLYDSRLLEYGTHAINLIDRGQKQPMAPGERQDDSGPDLSENLRLLKASVMGANIANHFHEVCSLGKAFGMEIVSPFVHPEVLDVAATLDDSNYFGTDHVKPVLRKIGEKYFTPELMYLPKKGFPSPHAYWTREMLGPLWEESKARFGLDSAFNDDLEFRWSVTAFHVLFDYLHLEEVPLFESA